MFFWNSLAFSMIQWMLATWSLVPLPFLKPAWTSGSSWFTYCWSLACRILSITLLACEMSTIVQQFEHSLGLEWKLTLGTMNYRNPQGNPKYPLTNSMNADCQPAYYWLGTIGHKEATLNQTDLPLAYCLVKRYIQEVSEAVVNETHKGLGCLRVGGWGEGREINCNVGSQGSHFKKLIFELNRKRWEEGLALWNTEVVPGKESHGPEAKEILWHLNMVTVSK